MKNMDFYSGAFAGPVNLQIAFGKKTPLVRYIERDIAMKSYLPLTFRNQMSHE